MEQYVSALNWVIFRLSIIKILGEHRIVSPRVSVEIAEAS